MGQMRNQKENRRNSELKWKTRYKNLWDAAKVELREKPVALSD